MRSVEVNTSVYALCAKKIDNTNAADTEDLEWVVDLVLNDRVGDLVREEREDGPAADGDKRSMVRIRGLQMRYGFTQERTLRRASG
jgi:hypothetical protein